jgi:hypothetical protein
MSNPEPTHQTLTRSYLPQVTTGQAGPWNIAISQHAFPDGQDTPCLALVSVSQAAPYRNQHASTCVPKTFEDTRAEHHKSTCGADVTLQNDMPAVVFRNPGSDNQSPTSDFWSPGLELDSSGISSPNTIPSETTPSQSAAEPAVNLKFVQYSPSRTRKLLAPKRGRGEEPSEKTGCYILASRQDALKTDMVRPHRFLILTPIF